MPHENQNEVVESIVRDICKVVSGNPEDEWGLNFFAIKNRINDALASATAEKEKEVERLSGEIIQWNKDCEIIAEKLNNSLAQLSSQQTIISELQAQCAEKDVLLRRSAEQNDCDDPRQESGLIKFCGECISCRLRAEITQAIESSPSNPVEAKPRPTEPPKLSGKQYGSVDEMMNNSITTEKGNVE